MRRDLLRHGGHAMAAGSSIAPANLTQLRERLNSLARHALSPDQLRPPLRLDAVVGLSQLTEEQLMELDKLRPPDKAILRCNWWSRA